MAATVLDVYVLGVGIAGVLFCGMQTTITAATNLLQLH